MKKVLSIFGTRPEAIKMAPVIKQLEQNPQYFKSIVCVTGQHREMLKQILTLFQIEPDFDLDLMQHNQTLSNLTSTLFLKIDEVIKKTKPDYILAQGDTTTVMVSAFVAFYHNIKFGHVEAGLRTESIKTPFPEETNRRVVDIMSTHYFAPTTKAQLALSAEKVPDNKVYVTGNTVIDALHLALEKDYDWQLGPLKNIPQSKKIIMVTAHRRESFGDGLEQICTAIKNISNELQNSNFIIIFPIHLNPNVQQPVRRTLSGIPNIYLLPPLDYLTMINLIKQSYLVLTDSGGIQEEASGLGIPVLVMRNETERYEGIEAGVSKLVGTNEENIFGGVISLINDAKIYSSMSKSICPYGDGKASEKIIEILKDEL